MVGVKVDVAFSAVRGIPAWARREREMDVSLLPDTFIDEFLALSVESRSEFAGVSQPAAELCDMDHIVRDLESCQLPLEFVMPGLVLTTEHDHHGKVGEMTK